MAKCKNCRQAEAVYGQGWGHKRYCFDCGSEYAKKQYEYRQIQKTLRDCERCGGKLTKTGHDNGHVLCRSCRQEIVDQRARHQKEMAFEAAATVEELKEWIKEYML